MAKNNNYHHGSLRASLIETGLELVAEKGVSVFTLRGVAKRAGVSTAAPYHHFKNKAELLEAMAAQGWLMMRDDFLQVLEKEETPVGKLHAIGTAYINFAVEHTAYFRVMSRPDLYCSGETIAYKGAGLEVFEMLNTAVRNCFPDKKPDDPCLSGEVLNAWVKVHGFATLWIDGPVRATSFGELGIDKLKEMLFRPPLACRPETEREEK